MTKLSATHSILAVLTASVIIACGGAALPPEEAPAEATSPDERLTRLYVFDCGRITLAEVSQSSIFSLSEDEVYRW